MRGSHPGSFEAAHEVRDGDFWNKATALEDGHETYDLVVVGGGISDCLPPISIVPPDRPRRS